MCSSDLSTLLKVLAGVTEIQGGEVRLGGGVQREWYAQHQLETLDAGSTIYEEARRAAKDETVPIIRKTLGSLGFSGQSVDKRVGVLSGGEKARVALARMVLRAPNVLLLDEPTNHLDLESINALNIALQRYDGTVLLVTHDHDLVDEVATRIWHFENHQIEDFKGNYADYLVDEIVPFVDREFRTLASREHRGCFGKSSGGYGAIVHGMKYAKYWGAVANHSGDAGFDFVYWHDWPNTLNELARHRQPRHKAGAYDALAEAGRKGLAEGLDDGRVRRFLDHVWKKEKLSHPEGH